MEKARDVLRDVMTTYNTSVAPGLDRLKQEIVQLGGRRGPGNSSLVVPRGRVEPRRLAESEEDLNVLGRLVGKAVIRAGGEDPEGGALRLGFMEGPRGFRFLHLEGSGVLLSYRVGFPLLPPPEGEDREASPPAKPNAWDETRRELYGRSRGKSADTLLMEDGEQMREPQEPPFDEGKVEGLKREILEAVKEAGRFRHLRPDETVTVVVSGPERPAGHGPTVIRRVARPDGRRMLTHVEEGGPPPRSSTLLVRVGKAHLDALAAGSMDAEAFRKQVEIFVY